jgi:hypothetical protein
VIASAALGQRCVAARGRQFCARLNKLLVEFGRVNLCKQLACFDRAPDVGGPVPQVGDHNRGPLKSIWGKVYRPAAA